LFLQCHIWVGIFNFGLPVGAVTGIGPSKGMKDRTRFFEDVHDVVRLVPAGRVTTYGAIAAYLGLKSAARMVGWAMNAAHVITGVPAHRVVNRNGLLSGKHHFGSPTEMQRLLEAEGVRVVDDQVQDFDKLLWEPLKELSEP
jgi:methylated-DNA-protein-cysteine methyltransferase-like protein